MTDIVERIEEALRHDTFWDTDAPPLLKDAVSEIKRLRLTDAEREAIEDAAGICEEHAEEYDGTDNSPIADTLRKLLKRTQ
jgi:hypothetical protein